ncbi:MAG: amidohydrolase family protein [Gammaproteobacteria bacterium]|jgi:imidazolonepropionase-like amidohydrolase|nr:amidohydrolase family protein [Gammaproteobacteria bacterium]MBT5052561.1 amidohydrolase family protein [Gammaproteobacteria bacterium]MDC0464336.1 amidohydrolase family protein [Pseudomonadales bacterium]
MLLRNVTLWDGCGSDYSSDYDAIRILPEGTLQCTTSDDRIGNEPTKDLAGAYVIPGLIDAHIHLCLDPEESDPFAHGKVPEAIQLEAMALRAKKMVEAGITAARDLGGGQWLELKIRDAILAGEIPGPRLICAGQPITSPGGHCHFWGGEAEDTAAAMTVIARQAEAGVDLIKVMATGGNITPGSKPMDAQFDGAVMQSIVNEANRLGYSVAAHCHGTDGIRHAADAGVTTIEHCSWVGPNGWGKHFDLELAKDIAEAGIWISPTVNAGWGRHLSNTNYLAAMNTRYQTMKSSGCQFIASTDAGIPNVFHEDLPKALAVYQAVAAFSNVETLRSATSDCALALGIESVTGSVVNGLSADLMILPESPLSDLRALQKPLEIYARGAAVLSS